MEFLFILFYFYFFFIFYLFFTFFFIYSEDTHSFPLYAPTFFSLKTQKAPKASNMSENNLPIDLEDQQSYRDVPEFDLLSDQISGSLIEISNNLSRLEKNIDVLKIKARDNSTENSTKYIQEQQRICVDLISSLMGMFKEISVHRKQMDRLDREQLNKSQVFVRDKLNRSIKALLDQFRGLQKEVTSVDAALNEQNTNTEHNQHELALKPAEETNAQNVTQQKSKLIMEYQPVNAEEVEYQQNMVQERERDIEQISHGVEELNEIFQDLSTIVTSQGEMVDNIETNIYSTLNDTRYASRHLKRADRYHRNRRKFCFWLLVIACVVLFFLILIIFA